VERNFKWRLLITLAVFVVSLVYIFPSLGPELPTWWHKILPTEKVHLGLDLKGGMHLILEVQTHKAVESSLDRTAEELKFSLRKASIPIRSIQRVEGDKLVVELTRSSDLDNLNKELDKNFEYLITKETVEEGDLQKITLVISDSEAERIKDLAARQAIETIRNRIDQFGVSEPDIRPQGADRIIIQLPGIKDPKRAIKLIGQTARLEFKLVDEDHSPQKALKDGPPPGTEILYEVKTDRQTGRTSRIPILLRKRVLMTGEYVTDAGVAFDNQFGTPYVTMSFDSKGARIFERITDANVNKRLAIVLDDVVRSAPNINEKISGGRATITGTFNLEEATDLAVVLRAGALAAPVKILEERTVGPSLGHDSINQGVQSILLGGFLVLVFMGVYYRMSGLIADLALLLNMVLIMAVLVIFKATLTLPGIAGIILTIGMSVDANVLIFERIREEIRLGKTPRAAVDGGFSKALWTILDAQITTLIVAMVLFQFGTGAIRGFAVTLSIGILASLFTALFVSRIVFDYLLTGVKMKAVSI